jgi:hypothetical protein
VSVSVKAAVPPVVVAVNVFAGLRSSVTLAPSRG